MSAPADRPHRADDPISLSMLGTLRSELDDGDTALHQDLSTLFGLVLAVRSAFTAWRISPEQSAEILAGLVVTGDDGQQWTVGATGGRWYRRPAGTTRWLQSEPPVGVTPVYDTPPDWLSVGVGAAIAAAEAALRATTAGTPAPRPLDPFVDGAINPFQRKDVTAPAAVPAAAEPVDVPLGADPHPAAVTVAADVDWLLDEWAEFDQQVADRRTRRSEPSPVEPPAPLPADLPADLDPDRALETALDAETPAAPAERPGWTGPVAAPRDRRSVNPESYFLPPED